MMLLFFFQKRKKNPTQNKGSTRTGGRSANHLLFVLSCICRRVGCWEELNRRMLLRGEYCSRTKITGGKKLKYSRGGKRVILACQTFSIKHA